MNKTPDTARQEADVKQELHAHMVELLVYIEDLEEEIDGEWGYGRKFSKVAADGDASKEWASTVALLCRTANELGS